MHGKEQEMTEIQEILSEVRSLSDRTSRIETHIEYQKEQFQRIEKALVALEETKAEVHKHGIQLKGMTWVFGVIVSIFTAKIFGKF